MAIAIVIVIILLVAAVTIFLTASRRRATTGTLSRETRSRDQSVEAASEPAASTSTELEATGRPRADDTRENMPGDVAVRDSNDVVVWEPVDEEEIGVNRRQFLNRALLGVSGFSAGVLGIGILGFLWPTGSSGFGGKIDAGNIDDILGQISDKRTPFYVPLAKTYLNPYPKNALPAAKKVASVQARAARLRRRARRPLPAVRPPRVSRPVVPVFAVVRVPLPRLEVQRGRREAGRPRAARSRPVHADRQRRW